MTVYKYFIKMALRNKAVILAYAVLFFVMALINSGTSVQREASFMETRLDIGIIDNSNSQLSESLQEYLSSKNNIIEMIDDENYIKEQIFLEITDAVIIIPEDFEEKVANKEGAVLLFKDERKGASYQIQNQINKFISFANATYDNGSFKLTDVTTALKEETEVSLVPAGNNINEKVNVWFKFYFNFMSYIILAVYISVIGFVMTDFTEREVENRRKVSSIRLLKFNKEIYLGQMTIAIILTTIFILGGLLIKGKYVGEIDFLKYVVNSFVFSFAALCLVFLINNVTNNKFVITGVSTVLSLGTSFISGVMVPQQFIGEKVLNIAKFFPTYYFVRINEMDISSFLDVKYEIFMQILFAVIFLLFGIYFSKVRQKA